MQVFPDTTAALATAYDSLQATAAPPGSTFESTMLADDKLFVVLAVVLLIWFGILAFLFLTDRKIARLERDLDENVASTDTV